MIVRKSIELGAGSLRERMLQENKFTIKQADVTVSNKVALK